MTLPVATGYQARVNTGKAALALALFASCYRPNLGNPGFYCHPTDNPACPDGQVCIGNRCINRSSIDAGMSSSPDLAVYTGPVGCHGYVGCLLACGSNTSCPPICDTRVSAAGKAAWQNALTCGQSWCLGPNGPTPGPGTGDCDIDPLSGMLIDAFGAPPNACAHCLDDAFAALFMTPCSSTTAPECNPAQCMAPYQACLADLP